MNIDSNPELISDLSAVLNKHSIDNALATPDFLLAQFLVQTLDNLADMQAHVVEWHDEPKNPRTFPPPVAVRVEYPRSPGSW